MDLIEQKAEALIGMFQYIDNKWEDNFTDYRQALQCAIICVDEIIGSYKSKSPNYESETYWHPIDYWEKVKERLLARQ